MVLACFAACFRPGKLGSSAAGSKAGWVLEEDSKTVPDDVLLALVAYLTPQEVAVARLVCRHWRTMLSCYTTALTLPTSFLAGKAAKSTLRSTSSHFPSVTQVALQHAGGWCDPVQARMDVEPLVQQERRGVCLEPLAAAFGQLQHLYVSDASFTRDPWSLEQLSWLPKLSSMSLSWDTGLWAPGQVAQEADALQPVFNMTQLTALHLSKHAHLFLGEVPLGDFALSAAAAGLHRLTRLHLDTVSTSDEGFVSLAALTCLTELSLRGQIAVSLGVMAKVFSAATGLQVLNLAGLLPCSKDLKRIAAAYGGHHPAPSSSRRHSGSRQQYPHHHSPGSSHASPGPGSSSSLGLIPSPAGSFGSSYGHSHSSSHRHGHGQSLHDGQLQQQPLGGSGSGWRSSKLWQQQEAMGVPHTTQRPPHGHHPSSSSRLQTNAGSLSAASAGAWSPHAGSNSSSPSAAAAAAASPSRSNSKGRFRSTDWSVVLLSLRRLRVLKLQSDLAFLGSCAALRSMGHVTHIELHGAAKFMQHGAHLRPYRGLPPSWLTQLSRDAAAAAAAAAGGGSSKAGSMLRAGGAWPGLVSLHIDNLQLADGFIQGVAQLGNLKTLIITGPCLLAQQQQQQHPGLGGVPPWQQLQQHQQQQQQAASAPGGATAFSHTAEGLAGLPGLSGLSEQGFTKPDPQEAWSTHKLVPSDPAAVLAAALASLSLGSDSSSSTTSSSTTSTSTTSPTSTTTTSSTSSGGGQQAVAPLFTASGMRPQLQPPAAAMLAAMQLQQAGPVFRSVLDADVLTRLSPLSQLSKFELHLQQHLPCGLQMTPFALGHLSVSWTGLTSLSLSVPAPARLPAAAADGSDAVLAVSEIAAYQLLVSLGSMQRLKHLNMTLADAGTGRGLPDAAQPLPGLAALAEQQQPALGAYSSGSNAIFAAVAALPWHMLPASLESLSLSGFWGLTPDNIKDLSTAAPLLRHLRLMYCQVCTAVCWSLPRFTPLLHTLVIKEDALGGVGSSSMAAIAGLQHVTSLGLTVEPCTHVGVLADCGSLRYLLLDGRSNTELRGIKGLTQLIRLRTLVLPLLHLHHTNKTLLATMQLALPHTHIMNVNRNFGLHHGCQWFKCFSAEDRQWWGVPVQPWSWHPTLDICP